MWKPVLSAANQVRLFFIPPKARTAMCPSGSRFHGQPQRSSCSSSCGASLNECLDRILIAEPVAAGDGVVGVLVETVVGLGHAGRAALGGDRVAAHGIDLGDHGDAEFGIDLGGGNRGAQSRATATYQKNVVRRSFHDSPPHGCTRYVVLHLDLSPHIFQRQSVKSKWKVRRVPFLCWVSAKEADRGTIKFLTCPDWRGDGHQRGPQDGALRESRSDGTGVGRRFPAPVTRLSLKSLRTSKLCGTTSTSR